MIKETDQAPQKAFQWPLPNRQGGNLAEGQLTFTEEIIKKILGKGIYLNILE